MLTSCSTFVIFTKNWVTLGANILQKENMPVLECLKIRWNEKLCSRLFCGYIYRVFVGTIDLWKMDLSSLHMYIKLTLSSKLKLVSQLLL